tara:strand:- start:1643 stop:2368 length:726 start_codon:yes stop_codon:yes gene_type:complete
MLKSNLIVVTGGTGRFGSVLKNLEGKKLSYLYPTKKELNILNVNSIKKYLKRKKPKILLHLAGLSRPMKIHDKDIKKSINLNIIGTANIVGVCSDLGIKLIYFSTSYVYPSTKGNYKETDDIYPINNYAWSKLGGESAVRLYKNSLILRVCMTEKPFIHKYAFKNFTTNFIFHDEVAKVLPKLFKYSGIINVGGPTKTVYEFAKKYNPKIKSKYIKKSINKTNRLNTSMNISKFKKIINGI